MKIAVVGAGIVGASAARELSRRGHRVFVYEQHPLGHHRGSSHGRSRIVRKAYPDPLFTRYILDAYPLWRDLESDLGKPLLYECGLIYAGNPDSPDLKGCLQGLQECQVPHEILEAKDLGARGMPYRLGESEIALYTPEAGWVQANFALRGTLESAVRHGATVLVQRASPSELSKDHDAVVVAAGSWATRHVPVPVTVTTQTIAYFQGQLDGPVWIEDGADLCYGFPSEPGARTHKVGIHRPGPRVEDLDVEGQISEADLATLSAASERRFGFGGPAVEAMSCRYTNTADERFLFGKIGDNGFYASACSGHGFKFGPWSGRVLADFVEGKRALDDYPEFRGPDA